MKTFRSQKKELVYGSYIYQYELSKQNRKTLSLTITPDLRISVKCPHRATDERVEQFLKKKWFWMQKQLAFFRKFRRKEYKREYVSGESFYYLGRQYQLIVVKGDFDEVKLLRGRLVVQTTEGIRDGSHTRKLLDVWYQARIEKVFTERYQEMQQRFKATSYPNLHVRPMSKRWGSFTPNNKIVLNPILIQVSSGCIDYVITHELCHLYHKNHSKDFYRLLDKKYPGWEVVKGKLEARFT